MNKWYVVTKDDADYLAHHGIKGQKWGVVHEQEIGKGSRSNSQIVGKGTNSSQRRIVNNSGLYVQRRGNRLNSNTQSGLTSSGSYRVDPSNPNSLIMKPKKNGKITSWPKEASVYSDAISWEAGLNGKPVNFTIDKHMVAQAGSWDNLGKMFMNEIVRTCEDTGMYITGAQRAQIFKSVMWGVADNAENLGADEYRDKKETWLTGTYSR